MFLRKILTDSVSALNCSLSHCIYPAVYSAHFTWSVVFSLNISLPFCSRAYLMSDRNAKRGAATSASASGSDTNFTMQLQTLKLQSLIQDSRWLNNEIDFTERVSASRYRFPTGDTGVQPSYQPSEGDAMSMSVNTQSQTASTSQNNSLYSVNASSRSPAYSTQVPSLGYYPSASSAPSVHTNNVSDLLTPLAHIQRAAIDNRLQPRSLACSYSFLNCSFTSNELDEWNTHCKAHFRGKLPKVVDCPFQCDWRADAATGEEAWSKREKHINNEHSVYDIIDTSRRPDKFLVSHLLNSKIIEGFEYKELRTNGRLSGSVFLRSARSDQPYRRERR